MIRNLSITMNHKLINEIDELASRYQVSRSKLLSVLVSDGLENLKSYPTEDQQKEAIQYKIKTIYKESK